MKLNLFKRIKELELQYRNLEERYKHYETLIFLMRRELYLRQHPYKYNVGDEIFINGEKYIIIRAEIYSTKTSNYKKEYVLRSAVYSLNGSEPKYLYLTEEEVTKKIFAYSAKA